MPSFRLFELAPGAGLKRIELRLEASKLTQRRLSADDEWAESTTDFSNHAEARVSFDQLCAVYGRKGKLLEKTDDGGPAQLQVAEVAAGAAEVVADWLLEEGPRVLGDELFKLYQLGGLPLGFEGRALISASVANVAVPSTGRHSSFFVHHPHFLMEALLKLPLLKTLTRLTFVERERSHDDELGRMVPGEVAAAVRVAVRSELGPTLERLEAGDFKRPGEGKPRLSDVARCSQLRALKLVFEQGFAWKGVEPGRLERLEVGFFTARAQLEPLGAQTFPALETLAVGVNQKANLMRALPALLAVDRFPRLRRLAVHLGAREFGLDEEGGDDAQVQARALLDALVQSALFARLKTLRLAVPLDLADLEAHRASLLRLERLEASLAFEEMETARALLPCFVPL